MKTFILFFALGQLCVPALGKNQWPSPKGFVNDFAQVMSADQVQNLEALLTQVEQQTNCQIAVVTVPTVEGADIDGAAVDLFKVWGIGKKGKDNGVLLLASIKDRKARIEVGYGLEGVLTDGDAGSILRSEVFPYFKQGDYGTGLTNGAQAVAQVIAQSQGVTLTGALAEVPSPQDQGSPLGFWGTMVLFIFFFLLLSLNRRRFYMGGMWGGGGFYGGGFGGGGGGFGGFGGGGSGGGGASGGW